MTLCSTCRVPGCDSRHDIPGNTIGRRLPYDTVFTGFNAFVGGGSFEVFYKSWGDSGGPGFPDQGWYWWSCWPGCLPDGDPSGPFPTAEGAYLDAIGE